ncbi:hypothetical protein D9M68_486350 [compost metagenome]
MKSLIFLAFLVAVISFSAKRSMAQFKNAKSAVVYIYGNCGMCENTIEKAGSNKFAKVNWNMETKKATITYDSLKTNPDSVLKRIALAGYDNEKFRAPDEVYAKLHECCLYERPVHTNAKPVQAEKLKKIEE